MDKDIELMESEVEYVPVKVELPPKDVALIDALHKQHLMVKYQIADVVSQAYDLETKKMALLEELSITQDKLVTQIKKSASLHGIDPDANPKDTGHSWNFDITTMTFTQVEGE